MNQSLAERRGPLRRMHRQLRIQILGGHNFFCTRDNIVNDIWPTIATAVLPITPTN